MPAVSDCQERKEETFCDLFSQSKTQAKARKEYAKDVWSVLIVSSIITCNYMTPETIYKNKPCSQFIC